MKIVQSEIKTLINTLGFNRLDGEQNIYYKNYPNNSSYVLKIDFDNKKIDYGNKVKLGDLTTCNFENSENFVVLECVDRLLCKGYPPEKLYLEYKWPMGRKEKGKLDVLVFDNDGKAYLMIECKKWGEEYEKEKKKMQRDGGQLFSYFQQDKSAQYLCLYTSRVFNEVLEFSNEIVKVDSAWKELDNQKEIFDHWSKNFKDNGVFEEWASAYDIEIKALTRGRLRELTEEDSGRIFNQFAEILRHNVVSDKPNAFNKIFNLFLCKIVDEDRKPSEELKFQWLETDTDEELQKRLSDLYKQGMKEYLTKEVTDYNDEQVEEKLYALDASVREQIRTMFTRVRLHKNNEFAFKEVFDEKSFNENAVVVREVVELLQPYQIRYGHKQQFLGDFFELLLSTGIKQEAGQFFTPVPIAKFIISSLPISELIKSKIENDESHFLPYIIDYAAGSGHFLTEAMDEVQNIILKIDETKQRPSIKRNLSSWKINPFDWAYDYVYGIEADYRLVKTAKVSCFLNGDGLANVIHADGLDHFQKSIEYKGKLKEVTSEDPKDNGAFDILVANPPYSVSAFKNTLKNGEDSFDLFSKLTDDSSEIECLFIERAKQLLKPGGWAGIILPSSILGNSGMYTHARELILKYFSIKAIAEFGSNTFMATGTNTVTLFLERRNNNDWKKIDSAIKSFFVRTVDTTINGIEKAFSKYVDEVFDSLSFEDYISFINRAPTETLIHEEIFEDYRIWFNELTEIKQLKKKKIFKSKTQDEQDNHLQNLFFEKVIAKEQDKILYFLLSHGQETTLIKVGEKQAEKDFIGYEFSSRRGHEGIKMYRDEQSKAITKLYDDDNPRNSDKANSYVYAALLGEKVEINDSMKDNLSIVKLIDLMSFSSSNFEKTISLSLKKKLDLKYKWPLFKLKQICELKIGGTPSRDETKYFRNGSNLWVSISELNGGVITDTKEKITDDGVKKSNVKLIKAGTTLVSFKLSIGKTAIAGKDLYTNEAIAGLVIRNNEKLIDKYLFSIFNSRYIDIDKDTYNAFGKSLNSKLLNEVKIPVPPKSIQEKIIFELESIDNEIAIKNKNLSEIHKAISTIVTGVKGKPTKLKTITSKIGSGATPRGGKSTYKVQGTSLIRSQNVYDHGFSMAGLAFIDDKQADKLSNVTVEINDILFNITGASIARCCLVPESVLPARVNQHVSIIRTNDLANAKFIQLVLTSQEFKNQLLYIGAGSTSRQAITKEQLEEFRVPLPTISDQIKLVEKISSYEEQLSLLNNEIIALNENKQQILHNYLSDS